MELQLRFWSPKPNVLTNHLPHFPSPNQQTLVHWHQRGIQTISEKSWNQFSNFWIRLIKFFSHLTQMVFPFDDFFKKSQKWPAISFAHRCACMEVTDWLRLPCGCFLPWFLSLKQRWKPPKKGDDQLIWPKETYKKKTQIISFECDDFGYDYSVDNDPMDLPSAWPPGACRRR